MNLDQAPTIALTMVLVAAIFVGGFLVLEGLLDEAACPTGFVWNASTELCNEAANTSATTTTATSNSTSAVVTGMSNVTDYAPTWGTIIGVAILLGIVLIGFSFGRSRSF